MRKRLWDGVKVGDVFAEFHVNEKTNLDEADKLFKDSIHIGDKMLSDIKLVYEAVK